MRRFTFGPTRSSNRKRCARMDAEVRPRNNFYRPNCLVCRRRKWLSMAPPRLAGVAYCAKCSVIVRKLRASVGRQVSREIAAGRLQKASSFTCVDCSAPATAYDHREYTKPLSVEPVCIPCNVRRGPAVDIAIATRNFKKTPPRRGRPTLRGPELWAKIALNVAKRDKANGASNGR